MFPEKLKKALRFYFITDDSAPNLSPLNQVKTAISAGATFVQYRNKSFSSEFINDAQAIRDLCKCNGVPFVINDNILLAKAVGADGVHLGQEDDPPLLARKILGDNAIIGISVSNLKELAKTDLTGCDYIGTGPVFLTRTKTDAKKPIGLEGLEAVIRAVSLPVVAIGAIDGNNASACFKHGASGIAVISFITRAANPIQNALILSEICGCPPRPHLELPWNDEFALIDTLLEHTPAKNAAEKYLKIPPGDDASLLNNLTNPVITTDTHKEGVHFMLDWQTPQEVGQKAVAITLSDLAAKYAQPICLFVNLSLPEHIGNLFVKTLYDGMVSALNKYNCALGGGNISRGTELSIDLFAVGQGQENLFPTRGAAKPGDGLYSTGPLGLARAGLQCLLKKDTGFKQLIEKFKIPIPRFDAARALATWRVTCTMDISDGLAGDAGHIARASHVSIEFDLKPDQFHPELITYCEKYRLSAEEMILAGGEDYELLFACRPEVFEAIKKTLPEAIQVGKCVPFRGRYLVNLPPGISSFQHGGR
ncbi:MAG: thiamine-phosphate kinase [Deltaproteobacteria bacterium]|nr:thiamine-phosphate kinase [Deltaproteobacteria bacterium]MBW1959820.1 thiamine-phosphate kinase [Deltaproteobacteria bacterium]MBW2153126.1 thiamine-phosphate kinase [Deltaproteobacteria bacterium]